MYEKEVEQEEAKLAKMKEEGKDEYVIKKQVSVQQEKAWSGWEDHLSVCLQGEVLLESQNIVPDCRRRIQAAYADLQSIMVSLSLFSFITTV